MISFAYTFDPEFYSREALEYLSGLPNLEQLQLAGCAVIDEDLSVISKSSRLTGIGLNQTGVTDHGLRYLESLPRLRQIEIDGTQISPGGLKRLQEKLGY